MDFKTTTVAYRCPACGAVTTSMTGIFQMDAPLFKLKCSCGGSQAVVEKMQNGQVLLTVPCVACPSPHVYALSEELFSTCEALPLGCSVCGVDLCFVGKENAVAKAVEDSNKEIATLLGDTAIESLKANGADDLSNPIIADIVGFTVSDLNEEGKINCGCNKGEGDYECVVHPDFVSVRCKKCQKSVIIPLDSTIDAYEFLNADELNLN